MLSREWGNGLWVHYWGLYRDYYRDPFPHSLLRTRQFRVSWSLAACCTDLDGAVLQDVTCVAAAAPCSWPFCSERGFGGDIHFNTVSPEMFRSFLTKVKLETTCSFLDSTVC